MRKFERKSIYGWKGNGNACFLIEIVSFYEDHLDLHVIIETKEFLCRYIRLMDTRKDQDSYLHDMEENRPIRRQYYRKILLPKDTIAEQSLDHQ